MGLSAPVLVPTLAGVENISAGLFHNIAEDHARSGISSWGDNLDGELGDGTTISRSVPTHINPGTFFAPSQYAAGGYHSLASFSDATTRAWGYNFYGQLGDGTTVSKSSAVLVPGNPGVSGAGRLASYGGTKAWGYNLDGELGDGTTTARSTPTPIVGLPVAMGAGYSFVNG